MTKPPAPPAPPSAKELQKKTPSAPAPVIPVVKPPTVPERLRSLADQLVTLASLIADPNVTDSQQHNASLKQIAAHLRELANA